jgi:hypothetical protein
MHAPPVMFIVVRALVVAAVVAILLTHRMGVVQVVLFIITMAVILLHEFVWLFWAGSFAALAILLGWPFISGLLRKRSTKRRETASSPAQPPPLGLRGQTNNVLDGNVADEGPGVSMRRLYDHPHSVDSMV